MQPPFLKEPQKSRHAPLPIGRVRYQGSLTRPSVPVESRHRTFPPKMRDQVLGTIGQLSRHIAQQYHGSADVHRDLPSSYRDSRAVQYWVCLTWQSTSRIASALLALHGEAVGIPNPKRQRICTISTMDGTWRIVLTIATKFRGSEVPNELSKRKDARPREKDVFPGRLLLGQSCVPSVLNNIEKHELFVGMKQRYACPAPPEPWSCRLQYRGSILY